MESLVALSRMVYAHKAGRISAMQLWLAALVALPPSDLPYWERGIRQRRFDNLIYQLKSRFNAEWLARSKATVLHWYVQAFGDWYCDISVRPGHKTMVTDTEERYPCFFPHYQQAMSANGHSWNRIRGIHQRDAQFRQLVCRQRWEELEKIRLSLKLAA